MASGSFLRHGSFVGNGSATPFEVTVGHRPKAVRIISTNGQVVWNERMDAPFQVIDSAASTQLGAEELVAVDFGFQVESTDPQLNANAVTYHWEAE